MENSNLMEKNKIKKEVIISDSFLKKGTKQPKKSYLRQFKGSKK